MSDVNTQVLVIGGSSRIAMALMSFFGDTAVFVRRRPVAGCSRELLVDHYESLSAEVFRGKRCVINCVGLTTGSVAALERINVVLPTRWATFAKSAQVEYFLQISSFSVYGRAQTINHRTSVAPASDYGRSKLAADTQLLALTDEKFAVSILRLPFIYADGSLGKLGQLLLWWERIRVLPVPAADISRAMIGAELAAEVIARLCLDRQTGVVFAADPQPFTYAAARRARGRRLFQIYLPAGLTEIIKRILPELGQRLFSDSKLDDLDNLAILYGLNSRLLGDIETDSIR